MKHRMWRGAWIYLADISMGRMRIGFMCLFVLLGPMALTSLAAQRQFLPSSISSVVTNLPVLRHSSRWNRLNLDIALPLRDRAGLTNLLQQLYDPTGTNYHHFLTPEQFAARFGPTESDYESVIKFAQSHGLRVTGKHSNRA